MKSKQWTVCLLLLVLATLILLGGITAVIDPFFHYHAPLKSLNYTIDQQRYQNDGIVRHFDYDAILTGNSMTENFKASECDSLFGVNSVKVCFNGASLTELSSNLRRAVSSNPNIRLIICGLDNWHLLEAQDAMRTDAEYPVYLYDNNPLNDAPYLLNKEILVNYAIQTLLDTRHGIPMTNFDDYSSWSHPTGMDAVLRINPRVPESKESLFLNDQLRRRIRENLSEKVIRTARENPDVQFCYFFPPYSILYWDTFDRTGTMTLELEAMKYASRLLLEEENIHLFSFFTDYETITNLDNYMDDHHYCAEINSLILQRMSRGEGLLTPDNWEAHWQEVEDFYRNFDYDALFEEPSQ